MSNILGGNITSNYGSSSSIVPLNQMQFPPFHMYILFYAIQFFYPTRYGRV